MGTASLLSKMRQPLSSILAAAQAREFSHHILFIAVCIVAGIVNACGRPLESASELATKFGPMVVTKNVVVINCSSDKIRFATFDSGVGICVNPWIDTRYRENVSYSRKERVRVIDKSWFKPRIVSDIS
jgi:hypothetical protein